MAEKLSKDFLVQIATQTKVCEYQGKEFTIKKLVGSKLKQLEEDSDSFELISAGLVEPSLTPEDLQECPVDFIKTLSDAVVSFNGMSLDKAEKN